MIRVDISSARPGDCLAHPLQHPAEPWKLLRPAGTQLNSRQINGLRRIGVRSAWLIDDGVDEFPDLLTGGQVAPLNKLLSKLQGIYAKVEADPSYRGSFASFRDAAVSAGRSLLDGGRLYTPPDDTRLRDGEVLVHGGKVAVLTVLMAASVGDDFLPSGGGERDSALAPLLLGALLHDVGRLRVPETIRYRAPWELASQEREILRSHTTRGFHLLRPQVGAIAANPALCHHLNVDGSGYPEEIEETGSHLPEGDQVLPCSRLVAVANAYEQLTSGRDYLPIEALEELNCARRHHFDPSALTALNRTVPAFSPGEVVELAAGHQGVVISFDPDRPFAGMVRLLRDPAGHSLTPAQRREFRIGDRPELFVHSLRGRTVEHLTPEDAAVRWEEMA